MNDIIVGIDRSETARDAAQRAARLAALYDTNLHIVMCVDRKPSAQVNVGGDQFRTDWLAEAEQFLADVSRTLPHDRITHAVEVGDPATSLCSEAARLDAQVIVVGNRRVQGMSRVLGSIAGNVAKAAPCDVLVADTCGRAA